MAGIRSVQFGLASCLVVAAAGLGAEPAKDERCLTHKQIIATLASIHNRGAAMYNSGDVAGCYRYFQGALEAVHPLLPKDIQEDVTQELARVDRQFDMGRRAFALHQLIEQVRKRLHPSGAAIPLGKPRRIEGETDEPPKAKIDPGKVKTDSPLLLEPPKANTGGTDSVKPKPVTSDGLTFPSRKPIEDGKKKEPEKKAPALIDLPMPPPMPEKKSPTLIDLSMPLPGAPEAKPPVKIGTDSIAPPLKLDPPGKAPLITIPSGASGAKPEPLPPPRSEKTTPAIPVSKPKIPMPPVQEPPTIVLPPGK